MEVTLNAEYVFGPLLAAVLAFIYRLCETEERQLPSNIKAALPVILAIAFGLIGIAYSGEAWTIRNIIDHMTYGFMAGTSASGTYRLATGKF